MLSEEPLGVFSRCERVEVVGVASLKRLDRLLLDILDVVLVSETNDGGELLEVVLWVTFVVPVAFECTIAISAATQLTCGESSARERGGSRVNRPDHP